MRGKYLMIVMAIAFLGVFLCCNGCKKSSGKESDNDKMASNAATLLCIKCGQIKSGELCCKPDQTKCPKCDLAKGSPGCCKIPKDAKIAAICAKCNKVIVDRACCGCYDAKCPIEDFAHTHKYPSPKEPE